MKNVFGSLVNFITSLSFIDVVFFLAVMVLIILVIVMIYIMRIDDESEGTFLSEDVLPPEVESPVVTENIDLASISKEIEATPPKPVSLTPYEEEQEERAIISYDELISNTGKIRLNYEEENEENGLVVKKVDMENLNNQDVELPALSSSVPEEFGSVPIMSYEKEEAFLLTLKKMQKMFF